MTRGLRRCTGGRAGRRRRGRIRLRLLGRRRGVLNAARRQRRGHLSAAGRSSVAVTSRVMVFRVPPQRPRVAVRLTATFGLALVRFLVTMSQHVAISAIIEVSMISFGPERFRPKSLGYLQVILSLECLSAHRADVLPLVAVRQFMFRQRRSVPEDFPAHLKPTISPVSRVSVGARRTFPGAEFAADGAHASMQAETVSDRIRGQSSGNSFDEFN